MVWACAKDWDTTHIGKKDTEVVIKDNEVKKILSVSLV